MRPPQPLATKRRGELTLGARWSGIELLDQLQSTQPATSEARRLPKAPLDKCVQRLTSCPLPETQEIQQIIDRGQAFLDEFDPDLTYIETARYRDEEEESDAEVKEGQEGQGKEEGVPELAQLRIRRDESLQEAQRLEQEAALAQDEAKKASKRAKAASEKAQAAEEMEMSMAAKAEEAARDAAEAQALAKEARDIAERDRDAVRAAEGGKAEL